MIKVSVMYPNADDVSFDIDYYCDTHLPLVSGLLGNALQNASADYAIAGAGPGQKAPFIAMGHMIFNSVEEFQEAFGPNAAEIMADLPNFTNAHPQMQISEIKV